MSRYEPATLFMAFAFLLAGCARKEPPPQSISGADTFKTAPVVNIFRRDHDIWIDVESYDDFTKATGAKSLDELFRRFPMSAQGRSDIVPGGLQNFNGTIAIEYRSEIMKSKIRNGRIEKDANESRASQP